jgi:hypothetical protein
MSSKPFDYDLAFSRNIGIYSDEEQALLKNKKVAVPGCGGVGGIHAQTLARSGIGSTRYTTTLYGYQKNRPWCWQSPTLYADGCLPK